MNEITNNLCTGCSACMNICPKQCITMKSNATGEIEPTINKSDCIHCGLCNQVCPQNVILEKHYPKECYVAWNKNPELRDIASSGGFAVGIAAYAIKNNYIFYYCAYDDNMDLRFFTAKNNEDLTRVCGSKYSQASILYTYNEIIKHLKSGEKVIFLSVPCQIAGLQALVKGHKYDNLITIDLVCHGTPPNDYLKQYVTSIIGTTESCDVSFRGKYQQYLSIYKNTQLVYQKYYTQDLYFTAFYKNIITRNSCYTCQYAQGNRVSDITIGDFWGLGELKKIEKLSKWCSLVLLNTDNGVSFFNTVKDLFIFEKRPVEEGIQGNGRLISPPGKSSEAEKFQKLYEKYGFTKSLHIMKIDREIFIKQHFGLFINIVNRLKSFITRIKNGIKRRLQ